MDCEIVNTAEAIHLNVPTSMGRVAHLCGDCLAQYGRRPQRHFKTRTGSPGKAARSKPRKVKRCLLPRF